MCMAPVEYNRDSTTYYRARYYDSSVGRFLSEHPIRFQGQMNFYDTVVSIRCYRYAAMHLMMLRR